MTRRKRRELEEQARLEEERKAAEEKSGAQESVYYPGIAFGSLNNCALPVCNKQMNAVQLPPIIQPISLIPFMQGGVTETAKKDDFDDDFDDFDDWD